MIILFTVYLKDFPDISLKISFQISVLQPVNMCSQIAVLKVNLAKFQ